MTKEGGK